LSKENSSRNVATVNGSKPVAVMQQNAGGVRSMAVHKGPTAGNAPRYETRDSAGNGAQLITSNPFARLVVVPVEARAFKFSVDNGRGGARTIFLPPVSFGAQRLLAREASFVPVSSAKGDW
jgi:hypothetical protein